MLDFTRFLIFRLFKCIVFFDNSISLCCFLIIEFHCKILSNYVHYYSILIRLISRRNFFFIPALLLSLPTSLYLPSLSVSVSYFILIVPMRDSLGKHSCMSSQFPIAMLNGTCFFPTVQLQVHLL